jgi:hypothetical protein
MFRLRWCPDLSVSSGPGRGERLSAWPVSCTGSVVCAPTARSWLSRSGSAVATSGGAIVFAGSTVIIALLSLWVADIPLVASLGYASAVAVLTAVLAAITLLPAILSLVGRHLFGAKLPDHAHNPRLARALHPGPRADSPADGHRDHAPDD